MSIEGQGHFLTLAQGHVHTKVQTGFSQKLLSGLPHVREKSGKLKFFQGQGIVREFCKLSGKFGNTVKCQGIVRELSGNFEF